MDPINPVAGNPTALNPQLVPENSKPTVQPSNHLAIISMALFVLLSLAAVVFLYYQNQQLKSMLASYQTVSASPSPSAMPTIIPTPSVSPKPSDHSNWKTYTNSKYSFEISFPNNFKALEDSTNLYGWPNAVVLIYKGGQSYDLPIEVWNTEAEYKAKYTDLSVLKIFRAKDGKFITLANINKDSTVAEIVSTFKFTQ